MHSFIGRVPLREPKSVKEVDRKNSVKSDEKNRPSHSTFPGHQSGAFRLRLRARKSNSFVKHQLSHVVALFFSSDPPSVAVSLPKTHTNTRCFGAVFLWLLFAPADFLEWCSFCLAIYLVRCCIILYHERVPCRSEADMTRATFPCRISLAEHTLPPMDFCRLIIRRRFISAAVIAVCHIYFSFC